MGEERAQHLWTAARREVAALFVLQRSDRPWQLPFAAALASGVPLAAGAYAGMPQAGSLGAVAGLSFLYLPATRLHHRIPVIMACAFGMVASYAVDVAGNFVPGAAIGLIACLAAAAMLFCKSQSLVPPGPLFMVMTASIAAFSPVHAEGAVLNLGFFVMGCIWACLVAVAYSAWLLRRRAPVEPPSLSREGLEMALVDSLLTGLFVGLSLALAEVLGLEKAYWVPVSCLAVLQGVTLRVSWSRHVHRILGTIIGIGVTWLLVPLLTDIWAIVVAVAILTFLIETAVVRHYAFAAIFITPLTILLAETSSPGAASINLLMEARLIDTIIGAAIGLAGALCLHSQRVRGVVHGGLAAVLPSRAT